MPAGVHALVAGWEWGIGWSGAGKGIFPQRSRRMAWSKQCLAGESERKSKFASTSQCGEWGSRPEREGAGTHPQGPGNCGVLFLGSAQLPRGQALGGPRADVVRAHGQGRGQGGGCRAKPVGKPWRHMGPGRKGACRCGRRWGGCSRGGVLTGNPEARVLSRWLRSPRLMGGEHRDSSVGRGWELSMS